MADMHSELQRDLRASLDARRELGPDYEAALVESFVERLDQAIAARVREEVRAQRPKKAKGGGGSGPAVPVAICSLIFGIPLTAITAEKAGIVGLLVVWIGIAVVNVAVALASRD
ncbi:hypothetical protein [Thermoactinospora rubra]|uniref:hypothetical protein n=1 Tax=Thermoactinospora rubra TaxID=1088767 RepID=UPI00198019F4|nr:hypothetical protein [Thermoactinospora rubra]